MRKLLNLKRTYPWQAFLSALSRALHYGMYDLARLEQMILDDVARGLFHLSEEDD